MLGVSFFFDVMDIWKFKSGVDSLIHENKECKKQHDVPYPYDFHNRDHVKNYELFKPGFFESGASCYPFNHHSHNCPGGLGVSLYEGHENCRPNISFPIKLSETAPFCARQWLRDPTLELVLADRYKARVRYDGPIHNIRLSRAAPNVVVIKDIDGDLTEIKNPLITTDGELYEKVSITEEQRGEIMEKYVIPEHLDRSVFYDLFYFIYSLF